ncbi:MAG: type VI secretion system baseplate subunit TssG [Terriglobia bacterium]
MSSPLAPPMPDFTNSSHGFHHTVDSALEILSRLGVPASRITIEMAGAGWPERWVVRQDPAAGQPLTPDVRISVSVAGFGFFNALPVGMWDAGGEAEAGTREILGPVDDPVEKLAHWIRGGARLFDVQPGNHDACMRWISLFGLAAEDWPEECWYNLAVLLPHLHRLAGREEGIRLALKLIFGLPLVEVRRRGAFNGFDEKDLSLLGARSSRLGVDLIVGDGMDDLARWIFIIGPVPLARYYEFHEEASERRLEAIFDLCVPCDQKYRVSWLVRDRDRAPRLGIAEENSRLGINTHLGKMMGGTPEGTRNETGRLDVEQR